MSKHWKEILDSERHLDFMSTFQAGGIPINFDEKLAEKYIYFVKECSFVFQFASIAQLETVIAFFAQKVHPSTRDFNNGLEHHWQSWSSRLPAGLLKGEKRLKILAALKKAKTDFTKNRI